VDAIAITEKDWAKLSLLPADTWPAPIVRPRLVMGLCESESEIAALITGAVRR
jgi:hypothetical protein